MSDIDALRDRIDALDGELIRLLNERAAVAREIGAFKQQEGLPIYSPDREESLLRKITKRNAGPLPADSLRAIYREIMSAALAIEKDIAIACLGPSGSITHRAARDKFGSSIRYQILGDAAAILQEVTSGRADCGVVPLCAIVKDFLNPSFDSLTENNLQVCSQILLPGGHGDSDQMPERILVIGAVLNPPTGQDATLLMLRVADKPDALDKALGLFQKHKIALERLARHPAAKGSHDTLVFIEVACHVRDLRMLGIPRDLSMRYPAVRILGSYPQPSGSDGEG